MSKLRENLWKDGQKDGRTDRTDGQTLFNGILPAEAWCPTSMITFEGKHLIT